MTVTELDRVADLIWSTLNTIENADKSKKEQLELIKPLIVSVYEHFTKIGKTKVLKHMQEEIYKLQRDIA
jgi:hypothetical protein